MRVALIEDNVGLAKGIAYRLEDDGHTVDVVHHGDDAHDFLRQEDCELIILDINLPGRSGLEILTELRRRADSRPVILLTAQSSTHDRVAGLDAGADDYLVKPFEMDELAARVRAVGRRKQAALNRFVAIGQLSLEIESLQLLFEGTALDIPKRELSVLACLANANGRVVGKQTLLDHVYGVGSETDEKVIEVYVSRLRKRLLPYGTSIRVSRGIGYSLVTTD